MKTLRLLYTPQTPEEGGIARDDAQIVNITDSRQEERLEPPQEQSLTPGLDPPTRDAGLDSDRTPLDRHELSRDDRRTNEERLNTLEQVFRSAVLERELALTLAGRPLVSGAVNQLIKLWRDDFDVYEEDGAIKISTRDGQTVPQAVTEWLASPEYSHFCKAASRGGTGAQGQATVSSSMHPVTPSNLGESIITQWRDAKPTRATLDESPGWGRPRRR
jgi:hypothetical protein